MKPVSEVTPLNDRIFALGVDAWMSEGGVVAGPAWEGDLAVASALGLILPSGDSLGVYMCRQPTAPWSHCLSTCRAKGWVKADIPSPGAHHLWHLKAPMLLSRPLTNRIKIWALGGLE